MNNQKFSVSRTEVNEKIEVYLKRKAKEKLEMGVITEPLHKEKVDELVYLGSLKNALEYTLEDLYSKYPDIRSRVEAVKAEREG